MSANMKKFVVWALLLCPGFSLFAKSPSGYYIYIPPVSGIGKTPEDNAVFAGSLAGEVTANNHKIAENRDKANFILTPELSRIPGQRATEQLYLLHVILTDSKTNAIITEQDLIYGSLEEVGGLLTIMMGNVFSAIMDKPGMGMTGWSGNGLYIGASVFWSPRNYNSDYGSATKMLNIGAGALIQLQFRNSVSVETGMALMPEWIGILYKGGDRLDWILEIPVLLKYTFNPGGFHLIEPYGGFYANFPMYGVGRSPLLSLCAGLQYGIKAGPGVAFLDARFSMGLEATRFNKKVDNTTVLYNNRSQIDIGIGYKFALFSR
jgi:hypothetical protein